MPQNKQKQQLNTPEGSDGNSGDVRAQRVEPLRDVGVPEDALPTLAETALGDAALFTNPRPTTYDDVLEIVRGAW